VITIDMGRKEGRGCYAPFAGGAVSPSNTTCPGAEVFFRTKWRLHPSSRKATIDMGQKFGGAVPFLWELGLHLTQSHLSRGLPVHAMFHLDPSNCFATVHQHHRQTDRQDMQTGQDRQWSDSIGRTVLQIRVGN